jgi:integrase
VRRVIKAETFAAVIRAYLASPKFDSLSDNTRSYQERILRWAEQPETLGAVSTEVIRPALIQAFLDGLADRPATQWQAQGVFRALEKWAIVRDLLPYPITTGTEATKPDGGHEPWTDEQIAIAERDAAPHIARAVTLASNTGQRGSDLVKMRWSDLEEDHGRLGINVIQHKTGVRLWIPLTQELERAIETWERRPTYLLLKPDGQPWRRSQLSDAWMKERDRKLPALAGLHLHGLRSTAVVRLRRAGATTGQIAAMIGMSEQMVNHYCRKSVQRENAMAAVVHLDTKGEQAKVITMPRRDVTR